MADYAVILNRTSSTTASLGSWNAASSSPRRNKMFDMELSSENAAADNQLLFVLQRNTAPGTLTAWTPVPLDPADAASGMTAGYNNTVEPTYTANAVLARIGLNQRATFRWQTDPTLGLIVPATASNGIGIATPTAPGTPLISATLYVRE